MTDPKMSTDTNPVDRSLNETARYAVGARREPGTGAGSGYTEAFNRLIALLSIKRPSGGAAERAVAEAILDKYPDISDLVQDDKGVNLAVVVAVGESSTLLSCHLDTVHGRKSRTTHLSAVPEPEDFRNTVEFLPETGLVRATDDVLGADDGAGVWLLLEMIDAGVPGAYVFHFSEEVGGVGSRGISALYPEFLKNFNRAIAFDRKGTHSVITHQSMGRCCSDEFADALAVALTDDSYFYTADDGGVFTDTANYTDDIGECTNVSVGYSAEHTSNESLDVDYLFSLRDRCIALDWEALPTVRKPGEVDPEDRWNFAGWGDPYRGVGQDDAYYRSGPAAVPDTDEMYRMSYREIVELCEDEPEVAAKVIFNLLYGEDDGGSGDEADTTVDPRHTHFSEDDDDIWDNDTPRLRVGMN